MEDRRSGQVEGSDSWASTARAHLNDVQMIAHYQPITREMLADSAVIRPLIQPLLDSAIRFYGNSGTWRIMNPDEAESIDPVDDVCACNPGRHVTPCPRASSAFSGY